MPYYTVRHKRSGQEYPLGKHDYAEPAVEQFNKQYGRALTTFGDGAASEDYEVLEEEQPNTHGLSHYVTSTVWGLYEAKPGAAMGLWTAETKVPTDEGGSAAIGDAKPQIGGTILQQTLIQRAPETAPSVPAQAYGPHFEINEKGIIAFAPPAALDRQGNHVARLRSLHPTLRDLSAGIAAALGVGNSPHSDLCDRAKAYRAEVDKPLEHVNFARLHIEGVRLTNADRAAAAKIAEGELPSLDGRVREEIDSLLQLHAPFIMATVEGIEIVAAEQRYHRRSGEEKEYREAAIELAKSLQDQPSVIDPAAASLILGAANQIGDGTNPERSGAAATGILRNFTITLATGASIVALPVLGSAALGTGGAIAGTIALLVAGEGLKKSKAFTDVASLITRSVDAASDANSDKKLQALATLFRSHLLLAREIEPKLRRLVRYEDGFSWINNWFDWARRKIAPLTTVPRAPAKSDTIKWSNLGATEILGVQNLINEIRGAHSASIHAYGEDKFVARYGERLRKIAHHKEFDFDHMIDLVRQNFEKPIWYISISVMDNETEVATVADSVGWILQDYGITHITYFREDYDHFFLFFDLAAQRP